MCSIARFTGRYQPAATVRPAVAAWKLPRPLKRASATLRFSFFYLLQIAGVPGIPEIARARERGTNLNTLLSRYGRAVSEAWHGDLVIEGVQCTRIFMLPGGCGGVSKFHRHARVQGARVDVRYTYTLKFIGATGEGGFAGRADSTGNWRRDGGHR